MRRKNEQNKRNMCTEEEAQVKPRRNVYLYGSSFNPPTLAHREIAAHFSKKCKNGDEMWILPVYRHIFNKDKKLIQYEDRMTMARLAMWDIPNVSITYLERTIFLDLLADEKNKSVNKNRTEEEIMKTFRTGSVNVLEWLTSKHPNVRFHWIMGADNFKDFHKWKNPERILELCRLHVLDRDGMLEKECLTAKERFSEGVEFHELENKCLDISSTSARMAETKDALEKQVLPEVAKYIMEQGFYSFNESS